MSAYVVGLTGQIGAGKSMVAGMLRELGGTVGYSAIVQTFGTKILGEDKEIDRAKLAEEVFGDPAKLHRLERILHPRVIARVLEARSMLPGEAVLVVEAIKLLEGDLRKICDQVWVVVAPRALLIERLATRGMRPGEVDLRLANQLSEDRFRAAADVVIENDGDRDRTRERVRDAWDRLSATGRSSLGRGT